MRALGPRSSPPARLGLRESRLDRFLHSSHLAAPRDEKRRARQLAGTLLGGVVAYGAGCGLMQYAGRDVLAQLLIVEALALCVLMVALRRGASLNLVANLFMGVAVPALAGFTLLSGGRFLGSLYGAMLVPLLTTLLAGPKSGARWTAFTAAYLVLTMVLSASGFEFPLTSGAVHPTTAQIGGALSLVLTSYGITWIYDVSRRRADAERAEADARASELEGELASLEKERLATELQRLERMAGGVAHDFNNILTVVMGAADFIRSISQDEEVRDLARTISFESERAAGHTQQLLRFTGHTQHRDDALDLFVVARETAAALAQPGIEIQLPDDPAPVIGDEALLREALQALLWNALEALPEAGGRVRLAGTRRTLERDELDGLWLGGNCEPGHYLGLRVRDEGRGMSPEVLARIFDPFFSTKTSNQKTGGRGLGMSALLGIVRMHGGALGIETAPREGTSVELYLPIATRPSAAHPASELPSVTRHSAASELPSVARHSGQLRVLVADDEDGVRDLVHALLEREGLAVTLAKDGAEALECYRLEGAHVDLVVLDFTMPGLNGSETARAIRAIDPEQRILLMSGYLESQTEAQLPGDQTRLFDGFVAKPFDAEELIAAVDTALGRETSKHA